MSAAPVKEIVIRHWLKRIYEIYMKKEDGTEVYCGASAVEIARSRAKQLASLHKVRVREVLDSPRA